MRVTKTIFLITIIAGLFLVGCCPAPKKVVMAPVEPIEVIESPCAAPKMTTSERQYPAAGPQGQAIRLSKLAPSQVVLNEPFDYKLKIRNITEQELLNVVVTDVKPKHMQINSSEPEMIVKEGQLRWHLGAIGPDETKTISINAVAIEMGTITTCAEVTYDTPTCAQIEIVNPQLRLSKTAPEKSLRCDRIPLTYVLLNEGSGHACDITIEDILPKGLRTSKGESKVVFSLDTLGPGESHEFNATVDAFKAGLYSGSASAFAKSGGRVNSNITQTMVTEPVLTIRESCPASQYIGRSLTYDIMVENIGDGIAKDTIVTATVPENTQFKSSSAGGAYTSSSPGVVTWKVGEMAPHSSKNLSMKLMLEEPGVLLTTATAKAFCADTVSDSCRTVLSGIPGILLEVVDVSDPIEVGGTETYIITVTNQGTAEDTGIVISGFLEDTMQYISSSGPTTASVLGNRVTFAPLASLAPKTSVSWSINVRAISEGDVRFKATMNSDQLGRDVLETEATRFYK